MRFGNQTNLPTPILRDEYVRGQHLEANSVEQKYRNADASIGEESRDYVALFYMSKDAVLYWLPKFFDYLESRAPRDSFHFESMISKLSNDDFERRIIPHATIEDKKRVLAYLDWWEKTLAPVELAWDHYGKDIYKARSLWRIN